VADNKVHRRKVIVYIDGFNLYFALKEKNWRGFMWLDVVALAKNLTGPDRDLVLTNYFTARIQQPVDKKARQTAYLDALGTLSGLQIHEGDYKDHTVLCNTCGRSWRDDKEKQTDVNIAVQMLLDAHTPDKVDDLILITADSDQVPAIKAVRGLGKRVVVMLPPRRASYLEVKLAADSSLELTAKKFKNSLLPDQVTRKDGFVIHKPARYTYHGPAIA
jgi:uncharacterized LabA/DUF88 family protein